MTSASSEAPQAPAERTPRLDLLIVALVLVVGGFLRFSHLEAGIPHAVGADEPQIMERVVAMMRTGDFNPHFFDWPSLTFYLHLAVASVAFLSGAQRGDWSRLDQVEAGDFYLQGRMLTAALGTLTIVLVYLVARRWGRATGLLAATIFAVVPYHVRESHFVLTDVPTALLTTLTLWLALRAGEQPAMSRFLLAGIAAGLATATKYNGLIVVLVPLVIAWTSGGRLGDRGIRTVVIVAATGFGFLVGTPYALLDLPKFLNDYAQLAAIFALQRGDVSGTAVYLRHFQLALGTVGLWLAAIGLVGAGWRGLAGPRRGPWLAVAVFVVVYFSVMAGSYQIYGRYLMPLLPLACLLSAIAVTAIAHRLGTVAMPAVVRYLAVGALATAAVAVPLRDSLAFTRGLGLETTVDQAYRWVTTNAAPGSRVVIERYSFRLPGRGYAAVPVHSLIEKTHADYVAEGATYLVASSEGYGGAFALGASHPDFVAYRTLFTLATEVAVFTPDAEHPGPEMRIFRVQQ